MATFGEALAQQTASRRDHRDVDVVLDRAVSERVQAIDARIDALDDEREQIVGAIEAERAELASDKRFGDTREQELDAREDAEMVRIQEQVTALLAEREAATEGTLWTFRFEQLPGQLWSEIAYRHPPRIDVGIDRRWGYNYHETNKEAATRSGAIVHRRPAEAEGGEPTEELEQLTAEQWDQLWGALTGHEFEKIVATVWDLNEYGPAQKVDQAGKAFRAGTDNKSS